MFSTPTNVPAGPAQWVRHTDYTSPWAQADVTFVIEGREVHANKTVLSLNSPVFERMFESDFLEKNASKIELPGKKLDGFLELLKVIHPPNKEINGSNVYHLVPIADEYQMTHVTERCEKYLLKLPPSVKHLVLADTYRLTTLRRVSMQFAKSTWLSELKRAREFKNIEPATLIELLNHKVERLEPEAERLYDCMLDIGQWAGHKKCIRAISTCPNAGGHSSKEGSHKSCITCNQFILENIEAACTKHVGAKWKEPESCVLL